MDRVAVVRVTLLGALAALAACADAPSAPLALAPRARPAFEAGDGNPPPPPADGEFLPGGGGTGCIIGQPCPPPTEVEVEVSGVRASVLVNPSSTFAFIAFASGNPSVVVSPEARVQETDRGLTGRGTILVPIGDRTGISGDVGVVDLSVVTGEVIPRAPLFARIVALRARLTRLDGSDIIVPQNSGPPLWYRYAALRFTY